MKSYGRPDESWDEARFRALIDEAIHAAKERGVPLAVHQDERGDVVMSRARIKHSFMYACVVITYVDKRTMKYATELTGNMPYERYTVEQMIPRMRDTPWCKNTCGAYSSTITRPAPAQTVEAKTPAVGTVFYGAPKGWPGSKFMRKEPFIAGMTDKSG